MYCPSVSPTGKVLPTQARVQLSVFHGAADTHFWNSLAFRRALLGSGILGAHARGMYFYALSRGRAAPMLELVTHSISFLLLAGRPVVRGRTFPSREPASRQPSPSHVHDLVPISCPSRRPTRRSCRRGLWIPSAGRKRRASTGPKRACCRCRLLRSASLPGRGPSAFYDQA